MRQRQINKAAMGIALLGLLPIIAFIVIFTLGGGTTAFLPVADEAQWKYVREYTDKLNNRNADIIFYKHAPNGPDNLKARRVNALNDQGLNLDLYQDCAYHVLILYDWDGTLDLTVSDMQKIQKLMVNDGFRIIYLGTEHYQTLFEGGVISSVPKENTKSLITFYNKSGICNFDPGFADDPVSMPIVNGITDEQKLVFTMVMELAQKDIFWS